MVRIVLYGLLIYFVVKTLFSSSTKKKKDFVPKNDINNAPKRDKKVKPDVGEYVDYEEVKD